MLDSRFQRFVVAYVDLAVGAQTILVLMRLSTNVGVGLFAAMLGVIAQFFPSGPGLRRPEGQQTAGFVAFQNAFPSPASHLRFSIK
mgnify:CR=1 FL=1